MVDLKADSVEVIGMNGSPVVECGRVLPIVRRRKDGAITDFDLLDKRVEWTSQKFGEAERLEGRWTSFGSPISIPTSCIDSDTGCISKQPVVLYVQEVLLDFAGKRLSDVPKSCSGIAPTWRHMKTTEGEYSICCESDMFVENLLADWATGLLNRFEHQLQQKFSKADLSRVADLALCAARSGAPRLQAYQGWVWAMPDEGRKRRCFDRFVHPEFPHTNWDAFSTALQLLDQKHQQPATSSQEGTGYPFASWAKQAQKLIGIGGHNALVLQG